MTLFHRSAATALAVTVAIAAGTPVLAQTQLFRNQTAQAGKVERIYVLPSLKKDCSTGPLGEVKVVIAPKNGALAVKKGKLKTPASYRCPNVETEAQAVFYKANPKFTGADEVAIQTKNSDGTVESTTIKITVSDKPAAKEGADL